MNTHPKISYVQNAHEAFARMAITDNVDVNDMGMRAVLLSLGRPVLFNDVHAPVLTVVSPDPITYTRPLVATSVGPLFVENIDTIIENGREIGKDSLNGYFRHDHKIEEHLRDLAMKGLDAIERSPDSAELRNLVRTAVLTYDLSKLSKDPQGDHTTFRFPETKAERANSLLKVYVVKDPLHRPLK